MSLNGSFIVFNKCKPVLNVSAGLEVHPASQCDACMCLHDVQLIHSHSPAVDELLKSGIAQHGP